MKRLCLALLVGAMCLSSLPIGLSAQCGVLYIYGDEHHLQMCDLDANGSIVDIYVWVMPMSIDGFRCVEFGNIEISDAMGEYVLELVPEYNPDLLQPIMQTSAGISACFPACRTDEWMWIYKQPFYIVTPEGFFMTLGPYETSPYPKILDCDYVEHEMLVYSPYAVNQCANLLEINCYCKCRPAELVNVAVEDAAEFVLALDCGTVEETMTAVDNYSLYVKGDTASTISISMITNESVYAYSYYRFTLGEPLEPFTTYTLRVDYIDGYLDDEDGAEIDFEHVLIATLLQEFKTELKGGGVELSWSLASVDDEIEFAVSRRSSGGEWTELPTGGIEQTDLTYTYLDDSVEPDESYVYRVEYDTGGSRVLLFQTEAVETPAMPLALEQNVPNPFNPVTEIRYYLPEAVDVRLEIYDISGRLVGRLADGLQPKGWQTVRWEGTDAGGRPVASGVYFYRLRAGKKVVSKKMVLLR